MELLQDYIKIFDNVISHELCDEIILEYNNLEEWCPSETSYGLHRNIRNCESINISSLKQISKNKILREKIDNILYKSFSNILIDLQKDFNHLIISQDSGYSLLKYEKDQFYVQHVDNSTKNPRTLSCSLCLNDDYDGGEFAFFDRTLKYKLKKGSAITFPSNFMYPHEILPVTKGTRYSIITWFT